jgi:hypothetical protein
MEIEGIVADFHTIIINKDNQRRRDEPLFIPTFSYQKHRIYNWDKLQ